MASGDKKPDAVRLEVRGENDLVSVEDNLLSIAGLGGLAETEAWTALGTNTQLSYCTHGAFRFFGKFPPPIATHLIQEYTEAQDDWVYDLMAGSGTTGVESLLLERRSLLNDLNPLSRLLSKVKTTPLDRKPMELALERVVEQYRPLSIDEYDFRPIGLRNPEHYFLEETANSLRGLRFAIEKEQDPDLRDYLMVAFLACIRRVSRATTQQGRLFLDVATAEPEALPFFVKRAEILISGIDNLPKKGFRPVITGYDVKDALPNEYLGKASLLILHPPYFNSYKYSGINSLELAWMGEDRKLFNKSEVREFFKVGREENVSKYVSDMTSVISNAAKAIKVGGHLALMIGDTRIHGNYIPVTKMVISEIDRDLSLEKVALRVPKYTEASWAASQRRNGDEVGVALCDFILVFRRSS